MNAFGRILHATDFDPAGAAAFAHALRIALDSRARLYLLHVEGESSEDEWASFPHVRAMLGRWGLLDPQKPPQAIEAELGLHVAKASLHARDVRSAVARFAREHACDLLVLWTHERSGLRNWFGESMAEDVARDARTLTLFIPGEVRGFVDPDTGRSNVSSVLIPIGDEFNSIYALRQLDTALRVIAPDAKPTFLHVGARAPELRDEAGARYDLPIVLRQGDVVGAILECAAEIGAQLIAMPTAGRHGLFDALRGSTTERVLREAKLPLLAAPAFSDE